jgi:cellulose synthase/poly-beta-1,6-N-acetylglucosamine synthase-like glycosyltransferase
MVTCVEEKLQCGQMPETFVGHVRQRTRWVMGNVQTAVKLHFRLGDVRLAKCTWRQRLAGVAVGASSILTAAMGIFGFVGLPLALVSGFPFVIFDNAWQLRWLVRTVAVWIFLDWFHRCAFAMATGYWHAMRWDQDRGSNSERRLFFIICAWILAAGLVGWTTSWYDKRC